MITLREALSEYGDVMLRALAEQWRVPAAEAETLPERLAAAMLDAEQVRAFVAALPAGARAALAQVAGSAGGAIRGHLLTRRHGEMRRLGPAAMQREAPWRNPANDTERLWYAGLIYRRYGRLGDYQGEMYQVPGDVLPLLPALQAPAAGRALQPVEPPAVVQDQGDGLALDLETLLGFLRRQPLPAPTGRNADVPLKPLLALAPRWRGPMEPERLALLLRLGQRGRLILRRETGFQVGAQARAWLQSPTYERQQALFAAWRSDPHWNELWRVPALRCEETGWRNDPLAARGAVLAALAQAPADWLAPGDFVAALKEAQPDFARPDGDYDSWFIRSAATGQYVQGFAHWDDVEGALIRHLLQRSLFWLGAVELGAAEEGAPVSAFRLTAAGLCLLQRAPAPAAQAPAPFEVRGDLTIAVPRAASAYDRARLERFARWQGREGEADLYRLEPEYTWRAFNGGIQPAQIEAFLQRASGQPLPEFVRAALRAWRRGYGRVTLRKAVLLQTADAETLRQLRGDAELAQRFGVVVSDRAILIPEDQLPGVLQRLKALGLWPRLEGLPGA